MCERAGPLVRAGKGGKGLTLGLTFVILWTQCRI